MTMLEKLIEGKKIKQCDIATQLGISRPAVSQQIKKGIKRIDIAKKYAKILNCNPLFLLD